MHRTSHAPRYYRLNLALLAVMASLTIGGLVVLPLWLLPIDARWGWLLVPIALLTNFFWALHHEAIHGGFHQDRQRNLRAGRLMAVLLGSSFHVLRFGHLTHHQYNRNPIDRPDVYDPAVTPRLKARAHLPRNAGIWIVFCGNRRAAGMLPAARGDQPHHRPGLSRR